MVDLFIVIVRMVVIIFSLRCLQKSASDIAGAWVCVAVAADGADDSSITEKREAAVDIEAWYH